MSDARITPWGEHFATGQSFALEVDRERLALALRRNTRYLLGYGLLCAVVVAGIVALAATDFGRLATYLLLSVLLVILLGSLGMGLWLRRRIRGFQSLTAPFITLGREGVTFAGIPRIGWGDVLGIIYGDESAGLTQGGRFARWSKNLTYRAGGAQVYLNVGIRGPKKYKAAARGDLARYLSAGLDLGGIIVHLDTALTERQLGDLRAALEAATELAGVRYLASDDRQRIVRAGTSMTRGHPMRHDA